ncbi:DUF1120 domain-containing protein [Achromobacter xylosoxidans]|uniref:DUF1120 domain-containing protein n=1 Tax=Alcaligenes xylosoxydans xylosoxydans TaxID=85698 RepID=UPI0006C1EF0B|nr:DUF1120 domain-containing protein [Achromobacter xylosoxidans]MCH1984787.1 DUF1120 domain-containing protein [Achromobacter xylosoxidans]MCH1992983.1 DUF1120 domain-containing protein [Achromobacter xylosoxidans]MCH4584454.1 DUF1120 domain-containing protein [Achromobacter xylosoxidans]OFL43017.1 hypothetical protein HMPREF2772_15625 [Achromobacter xylosoxidans]OFS31496.1 hypothetical protein HMPREF3069_29080 [Achromobacter xylosoxidans]
MSMTSKPLWRAIAIGASIVSINAQAQSIDVRVTGTITPAACVPAIEGGGTVDYGDISATSLNFTSSTKLPTKTIGFSITCDAPTLVGAAMHDNRAGSAVVGLVQRVKSQLSEDRAYGLGVAGGKNIGIYTVRFNPATATMDGNPGVLTRTNDRGRSWGTPVDGYVSELPEFIHAWTTGAGTARPFAFQVMSTTIDITAVIDKGENLDLANEVPLDGLATIELVYL